MAKCVFYSVNPYGTGDLKVGTSLQLTISGGVATLTASGSAEQTGNIGVGCDITYDTSTVGYIAPNRIKFDEGGNVNEVELLVGERVTGATSGATGIVRAVETDSGAWTTASNASGAIYMESVEGTFQDNELLNRDRPNDTNGGSICRADGTLEGNIGNGNTEFVVKTATGTDAANEVSAVTVNSISHEWASLSSAESAYTDSSHINNTDVTAAGADVQPHIACYHDQDDDTVDGEAVFGGTTTDSTHRPYAYTPVGGSESISNQRHPGYWSTDHYRMEKGADGVAVFNMEHDCRVEGLGVEQTSSTNHRRGIRCSMASENYYVAHNVVRYTTGTSAGSNSNGIAVDAAATTAHIENNIVHGAWANAGIAAAWVGAAELVVYNNTCYGAVYGISLQDSLANFGKMWIKNNNCDTNSTADYTKPGARSWTDLGGKGGNASSDTTSPDSDNSNDPSYVNEGSDNYLLDGGNSHLVDDGVDLESDSDSKLNLWRDIVRGDRTTETYWDIGANEVQPAGLLMQVTNYTMAGV